MTTESAELKKLLEFAVAIAREAGEITLKYFRKSFAIETKRDGSFVTAADREAEAHLRRRIIEYFPEDAILGEEEGERKGSSNRRWIVDPIDGTFSFVHGVPLYGVMVGLEIEDEAVLGVVNIPALSDLVYAARGLGCFWNGKLTTVSTNCDLREALLLATDFGVCDQYGFGNAAAQLESLVKARRTWGDCYGHVLVATGRAEIMLDPVMNVWDCAALKPIIEEAGGSFTDWKGARTIRGGNAISTNGALFDEVLRVIKNEQ